MKISLLISALVFTSTTMISFFPLNSLAAGNTPGGATTAAQQSGSSGVVLGKTGPGNDGNLNAQPGQLNQQPGTLSNPNPYLGANSATGAALAPPPTTQVPATLQPAQSLPQQPGSLGTPPNLSNPNP